MHIINKIIVCLFTIVFFASCEDAIELDSGFVEGQLVVDAWLTNESKPQIITLTESQDYFDNRLPTTITGAVVTVSSEGQVFSFQEAADGQYIWTPPAGTTLGSTDAEYELEVTISGEKYTASTVQKRVPEIDSIRIYLEDEAFGADEGLFAEVYARDLVGKGDTYWVKSYRNDTLLSRPQELNLIYDASFDSGTDIDGIYFIRPLRFAVNALDDDGAPRDLNSGDEVKVEVHSISTAAFRFMQTVQEQTTNGDNTIFALPVANALGNVRNDSTGDRVLGFFNVAGVSSLARTVE